MSSCLSPKIVRLAEWDDATTGQHIKKLIFNSPNTDDAFLMPCGKCINCEKNKSIEWSYRLMNELEANDNVGLFITLTYENDPVNVSKRDVQLFLKRLRKNTGQKLRYFASGEYGERFTRPHYHLLIFGLKLTDLKFLKKDKKNNLLYTSKMISQCWTLGFHSIGFINQYTCLYTAHYMQKFYDLPNGLEKPFYLMSTHPGIGAKYFDEHKHILDSDKIYVHGKYLKTPRYYLKLAESQGIDLTELKANRAANNSSLEVSDLKPRDDLEQKILHDLLM